MFEIQYVITDKLFVLPPCICWKSLENTEDQQDINSCVDGLKPHWLLKWFSLSGEERVLAAY